LAVTLLFTVVGHLASQLKRNKFDVFFLKKRLWAFLPPSAAGVRKKEANY